MKIYNKTQYKTSDLRNLFKRVIKKMGAEGVVRSIEVIHSNSPKKFKLRHYEENIITYHGLIHGRANLFGKRIRMTIPKSINISKVGDDGKYTFEKFELNQLNGNAIKTFTQIFEHEVSHLLGNWNHKDMVNWWDVNVDYIGDMTISKKEIKPKMKVDLQEKRRLHYSELLKKWERKQKMASNKVKSYRNKVKYYDRAIAMRVEK